MRARKRLVELQVVAFKIIKTVTSGMSEQLLATRISRKLSTLVSQPAVTRRSNTSSMATCLSAASRNELATRIRALCRIATARINPSIPATSRSVVRSAPRTTRPRAAHTWTNTEAVYTTSHKCSKGTIRRLQSQRAAAVGPEVTWEAPTRPKTSNSKLMVARG